MVDVDRKQLGAWYTPPELVAATVDAVVTADFVGARVISVLDPACGDGRFLAAVRDRVDRLGGRTELHGVDIDPPAVTAARTLVPTARIDHGDALTMSFEQPFDLVIGNPPYLSQLASRTTRGGSSIRGGGPYADVAVEFLALGAEVVDPNRGRVAFVLPQSVLSSRDAGSIRTSIDSRASLFWSSWTGIRLFDAQVHTCVLAFEFSTGVTTPIDWAGVVTRRSGVPDLPASVSSRGVLGDHASLNANFRDEYYGMVPAVGDHDAGPRLITSGLIDPGHTLWGRRSITFAKRRWDHPRVDLARLDAKMRRWADRRLVPKVLIANQTRIVEAVCDPSGSWLPAVPVIAAYPNGAHWDDAEPAAPDRLASAAWTIAAVLTSGFASAWLWHRGAGTGLSADTVRLSPVVLAELPWPAGELTGAVEALRRGDVRECGARVDKAYGMTDEAGMGPWWEELLERIESRQPPPAEA